MHTIFFEISNYASFTTPQKVKKMSLSDSGMAATCQLGPCRITAKISFSSFPPQTSPTFILYLILCYLTVLEALFLSLSISYLKLVRYTSPDDHHECLGRIMICTYRQYTIHNTTQTYSNSHICILQIGKEIQNSHTM